MRVGEGEDAPLVSVRRILGIRRADGVTDWSPQQQIVFPGGEKVDIKLKGRRIIQMILPQSVKAVFDGR